MAKFPVVLDVETQHSFREFSDPKDLKISVAAIYDYRDNQGKVFDEKNINQLFNILETASYIIGFNIVSFDLPVLAPYYAGKTSIFKSFDILDDIKSKIGFRLALNDVINATLNKRKTGHGLHAIDLYKEGKINDLKQYCLDDVMLTKELFDYGVKFKEIFYLDQIKKTAIKVDWQPYLEEAKNEDIPLTLPF